MLNTPPFIIDSSLEYPEDNLETDLLSQHHLTLSLSRLEYPLRAGKIAAFRKFINTFIGAENDLFHNHKSKTEYHYRYPLVQYKSFEGKAGIIGITETGVNALQSLLQNADFRERCIEWIGEQFAVTEQTTDTLALHAAPIYRYQLRQYLALNETNVEAWNAKPALAARVALLERCLVAHILKFASAIQWQLPAKSLQVQLLDFQCHVTRLHGVRFLSFDALFDTNITLPEGIGLGKSVSLGYGVCSPAMDKK